MSQFKSSEPLITNALDAVRFKLIRDDNDIDDDTKLFPPVYAHQIFGDSEMIFGYKDLKIRLYYTAASLHIYLGIKYNYRIDNFSMDEILADDIEAKIVALIHSGVCYTNIAEFQLKLAKEKEFLPYGEMINSHTITNQFGQTRQFVFYKCDVDTPGFLKFHTRLQTFLLWFVDAASYINVDDSQWVFFLCYEKYKSSEGKTMYATIGFSTVYLYYAYPAHIRPRISQMLVLPPFQQIGIGTKTTQVIYEYFRNDAKVRDITVEDPSEEFQSIRNYVDVSLCKHLPTFARDKLMNGINTEMINEARNKFRINARQCRIVYEILRFYYTNENNDEEYRKYRLEVKKRLNLNYHRQKQNILKMQKAGMDIQFILAGLSSPAERLEQLKQEYQKVINEYRRVLMRL